MTQVTTAAGIAGRLEPLLREAVGVQLPVRLRAWDGSESGPAGGIVVELRSPEALRHVMWRPGELGLARAYVSGALDVEGDLGDALAAVRHAIREATNGGRLPMSRRLLRPGLVWSAARAAVGAKVLGRAPEVPPEEARLRGRLHTPSRDRAAIRHHYDLGNDFYELLLDDTMSYSCGYWAADNARDGAAASRAKLDLVCRKLGLRPGMTLVDVGCGWGSLLVHAARQYGVRAVGYTISAAQAGYVRERVIREGLQDKVTVRARDYREIDVVDADAVASIEMGEHVGDEHYPTYASILFRTVRPGGRLLLQQMSRGENAPGGGPFIESYIAPDMHMRPLGDTVRMIGAAGFEVRDVEALREHYVLTIAAWARRLEERWDEMVALAGERTARIWRLYLAGGGLAFAENRMGVDQILAVRPDDAGQSRFPLSRTWLSTSAP